MTEDYYQLERYKASLGSVPEGLSYDEIREALDARIPYLSRHEATHRVFEESGINNLLDQLNALLVGQCIELMEVEVNG